VNHYAGIDVSLEWSSVCVVDGSGKVIREGKVATDPGALIGWFSHLGLAVARIGLEAGPQSQWLFAALRDAGLTIELMRLGWFRPVHCKSMEAQETRAILTARKLVQKTLHEVEMSLRGVLRNFGLRVGKVAARDFPFRIRELVAEHADLTEVAESLLRVREVLVREFSGFERRVRRMARQSPQAQLLMSTPGVGAIVSLTYASAIDDPARFASSKRVGAHFGMTPKRYQSGQIDYTGRISKIGDSRVRTALYEAANIILTKPIKGCTSLKSWAMRIAKRAGMAKAKVALARKLAVIMHRMLADGQPFNAAAAAA
jgi:transposase